MVNMLKQTKENFTENFKNMNTTMFSLLVGMLSGFIGGNISSCKLQDIINKKQYINYLILFFMIYFLTSWSGDKPMHPLHQLIASVLVLLYFTMIMRNNYIAIIVGFMLLLLSHQAKQYLDFIEKNNLVVSAKQKKNLKNIHKYCNTLGLVAFSAGFIVNIVMKMKGGDFNVIKHMFGRCG
jgi:hypothetical protein